MEEKQAERVSILIMNPQNGEIYACVNVPEFDLNDPFDSEYPKGYSPNDQRSKSRNCLNQMWRNPCLNDTYEPGSTFKIITMASRTGRRGSILWMTGFTARDISW